MGGVDEAGRDPQVLRERQGRHHAGTGDTPGARGEQSVDVAELEARVGGGIASHCGLSREHRAGFDEAPVPELRVGDAGDHRLARAAHAEGRPAT